MREPRFWRRSGSLLSRAAAPAAAIYGAVSGARMARPGASAGVPVFCVGNYHVGGAGKTPAVLALGEILKGLGEQPVVLSRGYGGRLPGPVQVDAERHAAADVGDEPLMMTRQMPVIVSRDRVAGATLARSIGASVIVMDDGFQNPSLKKDTSLIVIDARRGIGNGRVVPAGPLRAPLAGQLARTDSLIVIGEGEAANDVAAQVKGRGGAVWHARIVPEPASLAALRGHRLLAFAGIGDPERFFATLRDNGSDVAKTRAFPDHHVFSAADIAGLVSDAAREGLMMVTTEKDAARMRGTATAPEGLATLAIGLEFDRSDDLRRFLTQRLSLART